MRGRYFSSVLVLAAAGLVGLAPAALAQPEQATPETLDDQSLLRDINHFMQIDQYSFAGSYAAELLKRLDASPDGAVRLVSIVAEIDEEDRFIEAVSEMRRVDNLRSLGERLDAMYERGRLSQARHPDEIARNIELLKGTARARILGRDRLVYAGEYAMPQLLQTLLRGGDRALEAEISEVIKRMGRQAITPLVTALPDLDPARQEVVVNLLANIDYSTWLPFVLELRQATESQEVRAACDRAIARITGGRAVEGDVAYWFYELAERYYAEKSEVTSFPREQFQLLWRYDPGNGLVATAIDTNVFHEAMAMRLSERSLRHRQSGNDALALWLASNFSREIDTPEGYENPDYPPGKPDAMFYAVAFGHSQAQWVLARALDTRDTPLARRSIAAIERTAGAESMRAPMVSGVGTSVSQRRPLIDALGYPNRRVQYESALAMAMSQPRVFFEGSERVVPLLAGAIRDASKRYAIVIAPDVERSSSLRSFLEGQGYTVYAGRSLSELAEPLSNVPGVDVSVIDVPTSDLERSIEALRSDPRLIATPILALASGDGFDRAARQFDRDEMIAVRRTGITQQMMVNSLNDLIHEASGGVITEDEARAYATRALDALRDLAVANNPVLNVADAALPLMAALNETSGATRFKVAEVLSRISDQRVQMALMDAALSASGIERIELMNYTAQSAKRFGRMVHDRQVDQLRALVLSGQGLEGTAAAALMGSFNPPIEDLMPLVVPEHDARAGR